MMLHTQSLWTNISYLWLPFIIQFKHQKEKGNVFDQNLKIFTRANTVRNLNFYNKTPPFKNIGKYRKYRDLRHGLLILNYKKCVIH